MRKNKGFGWFLTLACSSALFCLIYFSPLALSSPNDSLMSQTMNPQIDTFVASGQPGKSFANEQGLWIGNRNFIGLGNQRTLLQFTVPADITKTATITTVTLSLYMDGWPPNDSPLTVQAYLVKRDWDAGITWNEISDVVDNNVPPIETVIPAAAGFYQWNVSSLLRSWINNTSHSQNFGILLRAKDETINHFRGFWSNECPPIQCDNKQPKLVIEYALPTPTFTPTATDTPLPTPGINSISLLNNPQGELRGGDEVRYTIELQNGTFSLGNVVVSNPLPDQMELLPNSIEAPTAWATSVENRTIRWVQSSLPVNEKVTLAYRAKRYIPTPIPTDTLVPTVPPSLTNTPSLIPTGTAKPGTPTATTTASSGTTTSTPTPTSTSVALTISKSGPAIVPFGSDIAYTLQVTNHLAINLTGITIFDLIPPGTEVVNFGGGAITMPPSQMIQWQVPLISSASTITRSFSVHLTRSANQIKNELYFVDVIENGELITRAVGQNPVVTVINSVPLIDQSTLLSPLKSDETSPPIVNEGALVEWEYPGYNGKKLSSSVRNPPFQIYLPAIGR